MLALKKRRLIEDGSIPESSIILCFVHLIYIIGIIRVFFLACSNIGSKHRTWYNAFNIVFWHKIGIAGNDHILRRSGEQLPMLTIVAIERYTIVIICWCRLESIKFHVATKVECRRYLSLLAEDGINVCVRGFAPWFVGKHVWLAFPGIAHDILARIIIAVGLMPRIIGINGYPIFYPIIIERKSITVCIVTGMYGIEIGCRVSAIPCVRCKSYELIALTGLGVNQCLVHRHALLAIAALCLCVIGAAIFTRSVFEYHRASKGAGLLSDVGIVLGFWGKIDHTCTLRISLRIEMKVFDRSRCPIRNKRRNC